MEIKDIKLKADIDDEPVEYVTFWGKIKGTIEKQEDLINYINKVKQSITNNVDDLKIKLSKLFTINDEYKIEGFSVNEDSEGVVEDFLVITDKKVINLLTKEEQITKTSQLINDGEGDVDSEGNIIKFVLSNELEGIDQELISEIEKKQNTLAEKNAGTGIIIDEDSEGNAVISVSLDILPEKTSDLVNDGNGEVDSEGNINSFVTQSELDLIEIPTKTSQLINDGDGELDSEGNFNEFITKSYLNSSLDEIKRNENLKFSLSEDNVLYSTFTSLVTDVISAILQSGDLSPRGGLELLTVGTNISNNEYDTLKYAAECLNTKSCSFILGDSIMFPVASKSTASEWHINLLIPFFSNDYGNFSIMISIKEVINDNLTLGVHIIPYA